ncbi:MAG: hypothetical protein J5596_00780 [Bacteroidaceae bacterium]|nr:hypothetical protein [Bacteroidaceae bacterium]
MKKIKLFGLIAAIVFAFTSCDLINDAKDAVDDYQDNQEAKYEESADGLKITVSYKQSGIGIYHIAEFEVKERDTLCTSLISKTTYPLEMTAKEVYEQMIKEMSADEKANITYKGKEITVNHPENIGEKKAGIKLAFQLICEGYKKGGQIVSDIDIPTDDGDEGGDE